MSTPPVVILATKLSSGQRWKISIIASLLFIILSSPLAYKLTDKATSLIGFHTTLSPGGTTIPGLILHFVVFLLVFRLIMQFY